MVVASTCSTLLATIGHRCTGGLAAACAARGVTIACEVRLLLRPCPRTSARMVRPREHASCTPRVSSPLRSLTMPVSYTGAVPRVAFPRGAARVLKLSLKAAGRAGVIGGRRRCLRPVSAGSTSRLVATSPSEPQWYRLVQLYSCKLSRHEAGVRTRCGCTVRPVSVLTKSFRLELKPYAALLRIWTGVRASHSKRFTIFAFSLVIPELLIPLH